MYKWSVIPLCKNQLKDVSETDIPNSGLYRKCNTYHSGGGYDKASGNPINHSITEQYIDLLFGGL